MRTLIIESIGPGASLQDRGRYGWQRYGVGPAGAMDALSHAAANLAVANPPDTVAIEFAMAGGRLRVDGGDVRIALTGAECRLTVGEREVPAGTGTLARAGEVIVVGPARRGVYAYLGIGGGLAVPATLGSLSLHARTGVGGLGGKRLEAGDRLAVAGDRASEGPDLAVDLPREETGPIRVVLGPQDDYFSERGLATLLGEGYRITARADRMGLRLDGPTIEHGPKGYNIVSDGIATGAVQVPGAGEPIILLRDRQTTGGYPKIATVVGADLDRLAQLPAGSLVRFKALTRQEAVATARARAAQLAALAASVRTVGAEASFEATRLLSLNLVDGWIAAEP
jgi:biotin-dependent carboxylase-like uncharacterized protein